MIKTFRISKTSMKYWELHGPIQDALKTTLQANAVRVVPVTANHHGEDTELELWVNADQDDSERHSLNIPATVILTIAEARKSGYHSTLADPEGGLSAMIMAAVPEETDVPRVYGPAILCGPGGTDIPAVHAECLMGALLGMDQESG